MEVQMTIDKKKSLNSIGQQSDEELGNKQDFGDVFSEHKGSELIKREYEALVNNIDSIVKNSFLKKEYYPNLPDGSNPEIDNICSHSASDIEERIKEGKGILYMNSCVSQTLYLINKLKKEFPHLSENMDLCIETLMLSKLNIRSVHTFIEIKGLDDKPIIIDYAHDNDVYVYRGPYINKGSLAIKTENIHTVPVTSFSENDDIFDIAIKSTILKKGDVDIVSQQLYDEFFSKILSSRKDQLIKHNTASRFEHWQNNNQEVKIYNELHEN